MRLRTFTTWLFLTVTTGAAAQAIDCNYRDELSGAARYKCLAKENSAAKVLLQGKLQQLIEMASATNPGYTNPALIEQSQRAMVKALKDAHAAWERQVQAECDTLLAASFGMGSGAPSASLECQIAKAHERIGYLISDASYAWIWRR